MSTIRVTAQSDIQTTIDASKPRDTLIFEQGQYLLNATWQFKSDRRYISQSAVLMPEENFDGPMIRVTGPFSPESIFQRIFSWICRIFGIQRFRTLVVGFTITGSKGVGIELQEAKQCKMQNNMVIGSQVGIHVSG